MLRAWPVSAQDSYLSVSGRASASLSPGQAGQPFHRSHSPALPNPDYTPPEATPCLPFPHLTLSWLPPVNLAFKALPDLASTSLTSSTVKPSSFILQEHPTPYHSNMSHYFTSMHLCTSYRSWLECSSLVSLQGKLIISKSIRYHLYQEAFPLPLCHLPSILINPLITGKILLLSLE